MGNMSFVRSVKFGRPGLPVLEQTLKLFQRSPLASQLEKNCTVLTLRPNKLGNSVNVTCLGMFPRSGSMFCLHLLFLAVGSGYGTDYSFTVETCALFAGSLHCFTHRGNDTFDYPVRSFLAPIALPI